MLVTLLALVSQYCHSPDHDIPAVVGGQAAEEPGGAGQECEQLLAMSELCVQYATLTH